MKRKHLNCRVQFQNLLASYSYRHRCEPSARVTTHIKQSGEEGIVHLSVGVPSADSTQH